MVKRLRIGLRFSYNENWIAGSYYILNLIEALKTLPDEKQPHLNIFSYDAQDFEVVKAINYPYIDFKIVRDGYYSYDFTLIERLINKISLLTQKKILFDNRPTDKDIDICFPFGAYQNDYFFDKISHHKKLYWIPDFQEFHLPHYFSEQDLKYRKQFQEKLVLDKSNLVFSSQDSLNDFKTIFPNANNKTFVLRFAVKHPNYESLNIEELLSKFNITSSYLFCPNQFWAHKNQKVVLKALKILKEKSCDVLVVFSGKMNDVRNPEYIQDFQNYIIENNLKDNVKCLGFIDRKEQLKLISNSLAVIQPSLFEGWSTVVEDCKSIGKYIILSDLNIHREQINNQVSFFDPHNELDLSFKIQKVLADPKEINVERSVKYSDNISNFAFNFLEIVNKLSILK